MFTKDGARRRAATIAAMLSCGVAVTLQLSTATAAPQPFSKDDSTPLTILKAVQIIVPPSTPTASVSQAASSSSPVGINGQWKLAFRDEFNGSSIDTSRWAVLENWDINGVKTHARNIRVDDGNLYLKLESSTSGAAMNSAKYDGAGTNGFLLPVGGYAEARLQMPGNGEQIYNWGAWWVSGPEWPAAGEHDVAEVLGGDLTVNYHSLTGSHNQGAVNGYWGDQYHVYGIHRLAGRADVYWDGKLVKSYATNDNGEGEALILNIGQGDGPHIYGADSEVAVDYVRAWLPQ